MENTAKYVTNYIGINKWMTNFYIKITYKVNYSKYSPELEL